MKSSEEVTVPVKNPELVPLFEQAKALLKPYASTFAARVDEPGHYELWSERQAEFAGHMRDGVYFVGLVIQKHYVGLYYMPIYAEPDAAKAFIGPELLSLLKGKSCFQLKKWTPEIEAQIRQALERGAAMYESRGWL